MLYNIASWHIRNAATHDAVPLDLPTSLARFGLACFIQYENLEKLVFVDILPYVTGKKTSKKFYRNRGDAIKDFKIICDVFIKVLDLCGAKSELKALVTALRDDPFMSLERLLQVMRDNAEEGNIQDAISIEAAFEGVASGHRSIEDARRLAEEEISSRNEETSLPLEIPIMDLEQEIRVLFGENWSDLSDSGKSILKSRNIIPIFPKREEMSPEALEEAFSEFEQKQMEERLKESQRSRRNRGGRIVLTSSGRKKIPLEELEERPPDFDQEQEQMKERPKREKMSPETLEEAFSEFEQKQMEERLKESQRSRRNRGGRIVLTSSGRKKIPLEELEERPPDFDQEQERKQEQMKEFQRSRRNRGRRK